MHNTLRAGIVLAALVSPRVALAQPATPGTAQASSIAQSRFDRGRALYDQQNFTAALVEFREAISAFRSPNIRLYLGLCLAQTGHIAEGYAEVSRALNEAGDLSATDRRYAATQERARFELTQLERRIARVTVRVNQPPEGTVVRVGGVEVGASAWGVAIPFDPGDIQVVAEANGYVSFQQTLHCSAGETSPIEITLRPAGNGSTTPGPRLVSSTPTGSPGLVSVRPPAMPTTVTVRRGGGVRVAGFVVAGLGVAGLGAFAAFGALAGSRFNTLQSDCNFRRCGASRVADIDAGQQTQTIANVALGVGLGALAVGVIMIAAGGSYEVTEARMARLSPWVDPNRGTFGLQGAF